MNSNNSIEVKNLKKQFAVRGTTFYGGTTKSGIKHVLKDITFELRKGEVLGVVGKNGCGKSTLLKIIAKIMDPDEGKLEVVGNVASILELRIGFDSELTGRDNIILKCGLYGLSRHEIDACIEDIIVFSELGEQIDHPLRTYSSGMIAKLAFSVLMYVKCDILIIDEVLSVGDASFNSKCRFAFSNMKKNGRSILLASHNTSVLQNMCDRVMWIDNGEVREIGDPITVCYHYESNIVDTYSSVLELAKSGDLPSMNRVGVMLRDGIGVEVDLIQAEYYFEKAASLGFIDAQLNLGRIKIQQGDIKSARELFLKASQTGYPEAITALLLLDNDPKTNTSLISRITELAEDGNSRAMKLLADIYYSGIIVQKNQKQAVEWYKKTAEFGNTQAMYTLGICYRDGIGVSKDVLQAIYYLENAANGGYNRARLELANIYRKGIGVDRDIVKTVYWLEEAAKCGDYNSMLELGRIYHAGTGTLPDEYKSKLWLQRYLDSAVADVENTLADIIYQGYYDETQKECIVWYEYASKKGNTKSMVSLSNLYRNCMTIAPDMSVVITNLTNASNYNNSIAMYELAMLYLNGLSEGSESDMKKLIVRSASLGYRKSMVLLTNLYNSGSKLFDENEYLKWLTFLSETGDYTSQVRLRQYNNHVKQKRQ